MKTFTIRLESNSPNCRPLVCDCGMLYIHIKPTVSLPIRTSETAPGDNLIMGSIAGITFLGDCDRDGRYEWDYSIQYDETQLEGEDPSITTCDVESMCCQDCTALALEKIIAKQIADLQEPIL